MKVYKLLFILFAFFLFSNASSAQKKMIDSLKNLSINQKGKEKITTHIRIATQFTGINLDSAKYYSELAYNAAKIAGYKKLICESIHQIGSLARENNEFESAISYFEKSLKLSKEINYQSLIAHSYSGIAQVDSKLGNYRKAIKNHYKVIPIYESLKDDKNLAISYLNLAIDFRKIKDLNECIKFNLKALDIFKKNNDLIHVATINNNLSGVYNDNKNYNKSIEVAKKAKKYFEENNYARYVPYPITNIAISYDSLNQVKKAKKNYLIAIGLQTKYNNTFALAYLNNAFGNFNYKQRNYYESVKITEVGLILAKKVNALELITSTSKTLAKGYSKINDFKKANLYLNLHLKSKDSLFQKEKSKDISELQFKYKTAEKEKEIAQQKEELLEKELAIKNRNLYAILLAFALLILGIIFFSVYKKNQFKKKQLQKEIDLKDALAKIKTQNRLQEQRLRISRDLHDNIGSQLTFIISSVDNLKYVTKDSNEKLKEKLSGISTFTSETIHQLRDTIWAMNKSEVTVEDLHARILSFIEKAKNATQNIEFSIAYNIDKNESFSSLEGMNLFRVVQEAINNAIKYAEASKIEIKIEEEENQFSIAVIDNGIGFDINTVALGNGLSNMEKRMSEIGGKVLISSTLNEGTSTVFFVAIKTFI